MRTLKTLKPGQKGTKDLLARYGPSLLCVRYRYDEVPLRRRPRERLKTVELVVERCSQERQTEPRGPGKVGVQANDAAPRSVALRIGWRERDLQWRIKSAGGRWDPVRKIRRLRRDAVERLGLLHRVVGGGA
ncbi:MAG: hypothetical protein V3T72_10320 [Thermoanaerobaculia bacterium]